ncbi:MAG TPA: hypothetical protein VK815_05790 [Candidatus Acidoferrales bacterium]|jgi:hypothetical protein|nr:hypothetical protein [Candidatus Acidoferrales bacterium]
MRILNKYFTQKVPRLIGLLLLAAMVWLVGCATPHPDPLAGWHVSDFRDFHSNTAIVADYKIYMQTLSPEEQRSAAPVFCYENGTGQHAVKITIGLEGVVWRHILIYDGDNRRIRVIKYKSGGYRC